MTGAPSAPPRPLYAAALQALYVTRPADRQAAATMLSMWRHFAELTPDEAEHLVDVVMDMLERGKGLS